MLNGAALKKCRKAKGLNQAQLAKLVHINPSNISNYETEKANPSPETITALAKALGVPVSKITTNIW